MGGTASKDAVGGPSYRPVVSRDKLLAMTQQPRELINEIFKVMVEKLTPKDILALSDPKVCPKYVFFMSDAIKQSFLQLRLRPLKDKQGVIYYASVEELQGKGKDPVLTDKEFNTHCLSVAFFYVRVFQIFGALALSVTDDVNAGRGFGARAVGVPRGQPRGAIGGPRVPVRSGWFGFGGSMDKETFMLDFDDYKTSSMTYRSLSDYSVLSPWLTPSRSNKISGTGKEIYYYSFDGSQNELELIITLDLNKLQQQRGVPYDPYRGGIFPTTTLGGSIHTVTISYLSSDLKDGKKMRISADFTSSGQETARGTNTYYIFTISGLKWRFQGSSQEPVSVGTIEPSLRKYVFKTDLSTSPLDGIEAHFAKVAKAISGQQVPGAPGATGATVPLTDPLATDFLMKAISAKQVSFGSARALQLLNIDALISDKANPESRICYDDFRDLPEFINLPRGGQGLGSVPAFRAMEILFFNDLRVTPDNKFSLIPGSQQAYTDFLTKMKGAFGKTSTVAIDDKTRLDSIKMDAVACGTDKKNKVLTVQKTAVKAVRGKVQNLLGIQGAHTSRVLQFILKNLIQVTKTGAGRSFVLHPRLFAGGLSEIDRIAKEAREMLLKHYVQCEEMYRTGVAVIPK